MNIRSKRNSHHKVLVDRQPTLAQFRLALEWRDIWRSEKLQSRPELVERVRPAKDKRVSRIEFARGIARAEFGRAYWDERRQRAVQQKPGENGKIKDAPPRKSRAMD